MNLLRQIISILISICMSPTPQGCRAGSDEIGAEEAKVEYCKKGAKDRRLSAAEKRQSSAVGTSFFSISNDPPLETVSGTVEPTNSCLFHCLCPLATCSLLVSKSSRSLYLTHPIALRRLWATVSVEEKDKIVVRANQQGKRTKRVD